MNMRMKRFSLIWSLGALVLQPACPTSSAEPIFDYERFLRDDGCRGVVRELYPKATTKLFYYENSSEILVVVYELTPRRQFLFVVSGNEKTLSVIKNGKSIPPEKLFVPRTVQIFNAIALPGGGSKRSDTVMDLNLGYLVDVEAGDTIELRGTYPTDGHKTYVASYNGTDGWRINIHPSSPQQKPEDTQQDVGEGRD
jgi:hypothetical protein